MRKSKVFLLEGYEMAYQNGWDLASREGQLRMVPLRSGFIRSYPSVASSAVLTNMVYNGTNQNDFGNPHALFSVVLGGAVHQHAYGLDKNGSLANPYIEDPFDHVTGRVKDPDRYPQGVVGVDRTNRGFQNVAHTSAPLFELVSGLQEGTFRYGSVYYNTRMNAMAVDGVVPIYEPSCGVDPGRKTSSGLCNGQVQRQVGIFTVAYTLGVLTDTLAKMFLKGGFMFYVERSTGHLIGSSNRALKLHDGSNNSIAAAQSDDQMVLDLTRWVLDERTAGAKTWQAVEAGTAQATIAGKTYFVYVCDYPRFKLAWIGVLAIPWDNVMEDIQRDKWVTLVTGMAIAVAAKLLLNILQGMTKNFLWQKVVHPAIDKAAERDLEQATEARISRQVSHGQFEANTLSF